MNHKDKQKIVVISGGNGSFITINALKKYKEDFDISAVISMSDSGRSTGILRKEFGFPPSDIMRATLAMSKYDSKMLKQIFFRNRFEGCGKLDTHYLGNLFLVLGTRYDGDMLNALKALHQALEAVGTVHPVTLDYCDLCVQLSNGDVIKSEHKIDRPEFDRSLKIKKAWLEPRPKIYEGAKKAIEEADVIVMGPGSLYCSVVATLLPNGVVEAIEKNKNAKLVYVIGNAYEKIGETGPEILGEFISELENYLPRKLDAVIYDDHKLSKQELDHYEQKNWGIIGCGEKCRIDERIIKADFEKSVGGLDPDKLGDVLKDVIIS